MIEQIDRHMKAIDAALRLLVRDDEFLKARFDILQTIPGIGETTAIMLLTEMPELGFIDHKDAIGVESSFDLDVVADERHQRGCIRNRNRDAIHGERVG